MKSKSFIQPLKILLVELTETHKKKYYTFFFLKRKKKKNYTWICEKKVYACDNDHDAILVGNMEWPLTNCRSLMHFFGPTIAA